MPPKPKPPELPVLDKLQAELTGLRNAVNRERAAYAEARARHDGLEREAQARADRIKAIAAETGAMDRARRARQRADRVSSTAARRKPAPPSSNSPPCRSSWPTAA